MNLSDKIDSDSTTALKARDDLRLQLLRMLKSDIRYKKIELRHELTDEEVVGVLITAAKKRKEAAEAFSRGGRDELAKQELEEYNIITEYLPEQLSQEELEKIVEKAIAEVEATSIKDLGSVMKALMPMVRGRSDGKIVSAVVRAKLGTV